MIPSAAPSTSNYARDTILKNAAVHGKFELG